jgi:octaprenyl-diphosphate synthase
VGEDLLGLKSSWVEMLDNLQAPFSKELKLVCRHIDTLLFADFAPVDKTIVHLFSKSGKMIRPTLLLMLADRKLARQQDLISMAAAIELIHTASLVHDDSIDKSTHRRGVETLNSKWNHRTSVIIGDYLLAQAFTEISRIADPRIIAEISSACCLLARGEMRQMSMEGDLSVTEEDYFTFIREKTAALFGATCSVAALLGGGADCQVLNRFGVLFGSIFQITDDMLDYVGSTEEIGKPTGLDIRERKMTLPLIHALTRLDPVSRGKVGEILAGESISPSQAAQVAELVIEAGGIDYAMSKVLELAREAERLTDEMTGPDQAAKLKELVELIVERDR